MDRRAAIFDLDGTLIDSLADIARLMNETLAEAGLPTHALDAYKRFVGSGITVLAERATAELDVDVAALVKDFRARYRAEPVRDTRPYAGVLEMLEELRSGGVALAVLSNKPHRLTAAIVPQLFGEATFAEIWGHKEDYPRKPDPTSAREVAARLEVAPERAVFIGDTDIDMYTAANAGMMPVAVTWGFRPVDELRAAGAEHVLTHPSELTRVLAQSSPATRLPR